MDAFYSLGLLLSRASVSLSKSLNARLEQDNIDLPHSQFIVLRTLYYKDSLSQLEIAKLLCKDAAAIKRTVDNLEQKQLVVRNQVRPQKNCVCITDKGKQLMPGVQQIADSVLEEALDGIDVRESELLKTMLDKVYTNLERI